MHLQLVQQSSSWVSREQRLLRQGHQRQVIEWLRRVYGARLVHTNMPLSHHLWLQCVRQARRGALRIAFLDAECITELDRLTLTNNSANV